MIKLIVAIIALLILSRIAYLIHSKVKLITYAKRGRHYVACPENKVTFLQNLRTLNHDKRVKDGVYIIQNLHDHRYYVGQSVNIFRRVTQHFTGHGNGDVYADFKYGQSFTVTLILLGDTSYDNLNDLERVYIARYKAYDLGYNKTRGNQ